MEQSVFFISSIKDMPFSFQNNGQFHISRDSWQLYMCALVHVAHNLAVCQQPNTARYSCSEPNTNSMLSVLKFYMES